jgi:hypothetical protein
VAVCSVAAVAARRAASRARPQAPAAVAAAPADPNGAGLNAGARVGDGLVTITYTLPTVVTPRFTG